jgi:hypothetical protein
VQNWIVVTLHLEAGVGAGQGKLRGFLTYLLKPTLDKLDVDNMPFF